jgi:hypothetical protein
LYKAHVEACTKRSYHLVYLLPIVATQFGQQQAAAPAEAGTRKMEESSDLGAGASVCAQPFGTVELGGSMFWRSVKIKFVLCFGAGDGISVMLITVLPLSPTPFST